jgi:hypothetical protein
MNWYSSKVRVVCLVQGHGAVRYMDSVHLFKANDFPDAHAVAVRLGRKHETEYANGDGELVRWRLQCLISLDCIQGKLDGAEVYSEPVPLEPGDAFAFDAAFRPEDSEPTQTV